MARTRGSWQPSSTGHRSGRDPLDSSEPLDSTEADPLTVPDGAVLRPVPGRPLRIGMLGTRGVPAAYGGFETAVEEVGRRLVARGHAVTVYCRGAADPTQRSYRGMALVHLPAVRSKSLETLSHTGMSAAHVLTRSRQDVALLFNAANSPFLPVLRAAGIPVATHVDGLEWKRAKWGGPGRRYYRAAESLAVRWSDAIITDAPGIADYYRTQFGADSHLITYGAPVLLDPPVTRLAELGLTPGGFHVVVARFEPENHVDVALQGYLRSAATRPLVVVGAAPYANRYTERIRDLAASDGRVRLLGSVYDQEVLDQLYAHAHTYVHGHSVGGTNPSLLRAMGAGTAVLAFDVEFNREVLGSAGRFFSAPAGLAALLEQAEADPDDVAGRALLLQERARTRYRWEDVADGYERLCLRLAAHEDVAPHSRGRRLAPLPLPGDAVPAQGVASLGGRSTSGRR